MVAELAALSGSISSIALSFLTLIGAVVLVVGLARAWVDRRRPQVVVEDLVAGAGLSTDDVASCSVAFRQMLRDAVTAESERARTSIEKTLRADVQAGLLRTSQGLTMETLTATLEKTTQDALAPLRSGMQAVAPDRSEGFVAALGALLPAQRGWQVRVAAVRRVGGVVPMVGLSVEVGAIGLSAEDTETFWASVDEPPGTRADESRPTALVERLLAPATDWAAIRLVSRQLTAPRPHGRSLKVGAGHSNDEIAGLQRQLAGQLALYASRRHVGWARPLARQALDDLRAAQELIPYYSRPPATTAQCRERMAWSYRRQGDLVHAAEEFTAAVDRWDDAAAAVSRSVSLAQEERLLRLARIDVRATKCLLLSDDPARLRLQPESVLAAARRSWAEAGDLYNAACLLAIAATDLPMSDAAAARTLDLAWQHLALALLASGRGSLVDHSVDDEELSALDQGRRRALAAHIRRTNPQRERIGGPRAAALVADALALVAGAGFPGPPPGASSGRPTPDVALPM